MKELELKIEGCPSEITKKQINNFSVKYESCRATNVDNIQKLIPLTGYRPKIHSNGRDFLVTWYDAISPYETFTFYAKRISYCGAEIDEVPIEIKKPFSDAYHDYPVYSVASDGKDYMIVMIRSRQGPPSINYYTTIYIVTEEGDVIYKDQGKELTSGEGVIYNPKIIFRNNYYYIVSAGHLGNTTTPTLKAWKLNRYGDVIDSRDIYIPSVGEALHLIDIAFDGSYFVIFWQNNPASSHNSLYSLQFDENLNPKQSSPVLIYSFSEWSFISRAIYSESRYMILYHHQINGLLYDAFLEVNIDNLSIICGSEDMEAQTPPDLLSYNTSNIIYYSKYDYNIYGRYIYSGCIIGDEALIAEKAVRNVNVLNGMAYNGNKVMMVWQNENIISDKTYSQYPLVYAGPISDELELYYSLLISKNMYFHNNADIAYGKEEHFVAWQDYRDLISSIYGTKVNSKHEVISDFIPIRSTSIPIVLPQVAYNGTKYAVISYDFTYSYIEKLWANIIDNGIVSEDILITTKGALIWKSHKIAPFPGGFAILYSRQDHDDIDVVCRILHNDGSLSDEINLSNNEGVQAEGDIIYNSMRDEFFVVWADGRYGDADLWGARFNLSGFIERFPIREFTSEIEVYPSLAISPNGYLLSWTNYGLNSNYDVLLDFNGNVQTSAKEICGEFSYFMDSAFDGDNYFVVFQRWEEIRGALINPLTGEVNQECGVVLADKNYYSSPVTAVDTDGLSFLVSMNLLLGYPYNAWRIHVNSYERLVVEGIEPFAGCSNTGTEVIIKGRGFKDGAIAYFNGTAVSTDYINCHNIRAIVPPMPNGTYDVRVINPDGEISELVNAYKSVSNAYITSIDKSNGCQTGGTWIVITGGNFIDGVTKAYVKGVAVDTEYIDSSHVRFKTPEFEAGIVSISVGNANCTPASSDISFKYIEIPKVLDTDPHSAPSNGGSEIVIIGDKFDEISRVFFKAEVNNEIIESDVASFVLIDSYRISAITSQFGSPTSAVATVCVQNSDCSPVCLPEAFGFYKNGEYIITPNVGTTSGGTKVKIFGPQLNQILMVMFGGVRAAIEYQANDMIIARTRVHTEGIVNVVLRRKPPYPPVVLPSAYEYATLAYVIGDAPYVEVLDTTLDILIDFNPYEPGRQSKIFLENYIRNASFSIFARKYSPQPSGRYAFFVDNQRVIKIDTGTNEIIAVGPQIFPPRPPTGIWRDIGTAIMRLGSDGANVLVIAANNFLAGQCGDVAGIVTIDSNTLEIIDSISIPELADASLINLGMLNNKAFITGLKGTDGLPYYQVVVEVNISNEDGHIESSQIHYAPYIITKFDGLYNIGVDILDTFCYMDQRYQCVYYVAPESNDINVINLNPYCTCPKPNFKPDFQIAPQDVSIGFVHIPPLYWGWSAFVIDSSDNKFTRIDDLINVPMPWNEKGYVKGKTPVDSEIRSVYDKLYIANMNSVGEEADISKLSPPWDKIYKIMGISDDFHPKAIEIQDVITASSFIELARAEIELMNDSDFTTPSKRQVLLNRLQVIENLIDKEANVQSIISNIEAFQNQATKFIVNETKKEDILGYSEALIQSII